VDTPAKISCKPTPKPFSTLALILDSDADAERLGCFDIFEAASHAPVAHPVTHENLGLLVWVGIGIGIGFCAVSNCR
jgi:hypothetical protein